MTRSHVSGVFRCLLAAVWIAGAWAGVALGEDAGTTAEAADGAATTGDTSKDLSMSLTYAAPELIPTLRQNPNYFGSPWQHEGGLLERSDVKPESGKETVK